MKNILLSSCAIALLGACGGSSGGTGPIIRPGGPGATTINQANTGFATQTSQVDPAPDGTTFTVSTDLVFVDDPSSTLAINQRDVTITATDDPNKIQVTVNGTSFTATSTDNGNTYEGTVGGKSIIFAKDGVGDDVVVAVIGVANDPVLDNATQGEVGILFYGYNTDPATLAARADANAVYQGDVAYFAGTSLGEVVQGSGNITLSADFAEMRISGNIGLDANVINGTSGTIPIGVSATDITGNSFATTLVVNPADFDGTSIDSTGLRGAFYGASGAETAGTFFITGRSVEGGVTETGVLQGGFAASN